MEAAGNGLDRLGSRCAGNGAGNSRTKSFSPDTRCASVVTLGGLTCQAATEWCALGPDAYHAR